MRCFSDLIFFTIESKKLDSINFYCKNDIFWLVWFGWLSVVIVEIFDDVKYNLDIVYNNIHFSMKEYTMSWWSFAWLILLFYIVCGYMVLYDYMASKMIM